jgi:uncharacterized membrane protein (UPF0182 family)
MCEVDHTMISADMPPGRVFPPAHNRTRRLVLWGVLAFFFIVVISPQLVSLGTDLYWYREIGFEQVFSTSLTWRAILFLTAGAVTFAFLHGNVRYATSGPSRTPIIVTNARTGQQTDLSRFLPRLGMAGALVIAFAAGVASSTRWMIALQELHGVSSGITDPVFGRDISFYFFRLPAIERVIGGLTTLTVLTLIIVAVLYLLSGAFSVNLNPGPHRPTGGVKMDARASRHIGALLALYFVLLAADMWYLKTASLLFGTSGPLVGAGYTDVHVRLPAIRLSAIVALIGAGIIVAGMFRGRLVRSTAIAIALYLGVAIIGRGIIPAAVQRFSVIPNELDRETPYLARHLEATRQAWALDSVTTRDLAGDAQLTLDDIRANGATIENVRLWERDLVQQTFGQLQEIRTYYDFVSVADDRYIIDGRYRQVHLAARELNSASLPTRTFINEHLTFTHGMGVTMAPVNQVTSEGLPVLFIKDLPPASTTSLQLSRPQIYFGQLTNSYVFVGAGQDEFDYPSGDGNAHTRYTGRGGVPLGSLFRRMMYAWQFHSMKLLLSNDIADSARILYRRNIEERARAALPFLGFDLEPYLVVSDSGHLKWILDAYTGTGRYPYAQRVRDGLSYMRNSVKVVIDAYDGTVDAYMVDEKDPIIRTVALIFPGIFKPMSAMPADIRRHIRFPSDLFRIQAQIQSTYHMLEPETFYHREDQWQIPGVDDDDDESVEFMRHIILKLPGEATPEFIYMTPFTPRGKDNLAAWMVARMDGDHYGEMIVYRFPKQSLVYGPHQVANRINQDTDISRELTLWDQRGSEVIRGELLVIPIEESLLYVQPIFTRAAGGTIPELKRVVVAHGNRVVMRETLESGLAELFGGTATPRATTAVASSSTEAAASADVSSLAQRAQEHYDRAIAAQRAGNWADYGKEIEALGTVLKQLRGR